MSAWCASTACESCCTIHILVRAYSKRRACDTRTPPAELPLFREAARHHPFVFSHWKKKFRFMSGKRILCVVLYFAGEQHTIRLVFSVAVRCVFFYLFLRVACYCICIRACFFLIFCFSFLLLPRVAPCDEEQHPVYIHHAVDAFFSGRTHGRNK